MFARILSACSIAVIYTLLPALGSMASAEEKATFKVCADPNNPPFSDRSLGGFENRIAEMFAKELGQKIEYTWFPQRMGFIRNTLKAKLPNSDEYKCDVVMGLPTGYELAITTQPYYRSVYALVYLKHKGWDDIHSPEDLANLDPERRKTLRIAMFDRGPGTAWLHKHGFIGNGVPYQSMSGDPNINTSIVMAREFKKGNIDMAILWGPMAGYLLSENGRDKFELIPMKSKPGLKFDFPISLGVRFGEKERKAELSQLISKKSEQIRSLLLEYNMPLVDENGQILTVLSSN